MNTDSTFFNGEQLSKENTIVSDSIIYIHKYMFYKQLKKQNETDRDASLRISQMDDLEWFNPFFSPLIHETFKYKKVQNPLFILYFSKIDNNILLCEVMPILIPLKYSYHSNAFFNKSYQYLFLFDQNDLIKKIEKKVITYN